MYAAFSRIYTRVVTEAATAMTSLRLVHADAVGEAAWSSGDSAAVDWLGKPELATARAYAPQDHQRGPQNLAPSRICAAPGGCVALIRPESGGASRHARSPAGSST